MKITNTPLKGLIVLEPEVFTDDRGYFLEIFHQKRFLEAGIDSKFVQENHSRSSKGVTRGLHYQIRNPQAQLVTVIRGRIFDVGVDLRKASPTFGDWYGVELHENGPRQIYMAPGFAHGFCVLSDWADLHYKVTEFYNPHDESGLIWDDPTVGINWPTIERSVSSRDLKFSKLSEKTNSDLPQFLNHDFLNRIH